MSEFFKVWVIWFPMQKISAGLLMYRMKNNQPEVFLVHPGGPFWKDKDFKTWSIPKGEVNEGEDLIEGAKREFFEETGIKAEGKFVSLGTVRRTGKIVHAWAFTGDFNGFLTRQNMVEIEFPYKSGKKIKVPEIDRAEFFTIEKAKERIVKYQQEFLERLKKILKGNA